MNPNQILYVLLLFLITFVVSVGTVRLSITLSHRLDILDRPDPRKSHRAPVAYLGGLGMLLGFLAGLLAFSWIFPGAALTNMAFLSGLMLGAVLIFTVGFYDDVRPIKAIVKLVLQIGVAALMWWFGARVEMIRLMGAGGEDINNLASLLITVGWYVGLMNSINLVDGLDGLAGGICFIGAVSLVGVSIVIGYSPDVFLGACLSTLIAGCVLGFLLFNWNPARTFMGDGGSLLLGFLLATASVVGSTKTPTLLALSVPMVALGLPLFETFFSFFRRLLRGQHPFKPDRRHIHHRLLAIGLDQGRTVLILHFITAFLGINSVLLANSQSEVLFLNVLFLIVGIVLMIENLKYLERKKGVAFSDAPQAADPPDETRPTDSAASVAPARRPA